MIEAVVRLGDQVPNKIMRQVAVVADRNMMMAGMLPRIVIRLHYMAIGARRRITDQIAVTFAVAEGK